MKDFDYQKAIENLRMFTCDDLVQIFHVHKNQINIWRDMGILKGTRTGKNIMYSQQEVREFQERFKGCDISNKVHIRNVLNELGENHE